LKIIRLFVKIFFYNNIINGMIYFYSSIRQIAFAVKNNINNIHFTRLERHVSIKTRILFTIKDRVLLLDYTTTVRNRAIPRKGNRDEK